MTLTVKITNKGNQSGDTLIIRGVKSNYYKEEREDGCIGSFQFGGNDIMCIMPDKSALFWPNTDHFGDFDTMELKGKH